MSTPCRFVRRNYLTRRFRLSQVQIAKFDNWGWVLHIDEARIIFSAHLPVPTNSHLGHCKLRIGTVLKLNQLKTITMKACKYSSNKVNLGQLRSIMEDKAGQSRSKEVTLLCWACSVRWTIVLWNLDASCCIFLTMFLFQNWELGLSLCR